MLQSEIFASTSGHTAACVVLYSAIRSGLVPITMPMRFITVPPIADLSLGSLLVPSLLPMSFPHKRESSDGRHAAGRSVWRRLAWIRASAGMTDVLIKLRTQKCPGAESIGAAE